MRGCCCARLLGLIRLFVPQVAALVLARCAAATVVAVAFADHIWRPAPSRDGPAAERVDPGIHPCFPGSIPAGARAAPEAEAGPHR